MPIQKPDSEAELIERRTFSTADAKFEIEEREDGSPSKIVGYASVFYDGTPDSQYQLWDNVYERIDAKAFDRALAERQDVVGLLNHDPNHILGRTSAGTMKLEVFSKGLRYTIQNNETQASRDTIANIKSGNLQGSSFSFIARSERWDTEGDNEIRTVLDADVFDVGPVTFPAYKATTAGMRSEQFAEARSSYNAWKANQIPEPTAEEIAEKLKGYAERAKEVAGPEAQ